MRVLLISIWKPKRGGIVTRVENLIKNSRSEFEILTYEKYINLPILRALSFIFFGFFKGLRKDFDIIHAHYAVPQGFLGVMLKKILKKPLVVTLHGSDITILAKRAITKPAVRLVLKNSDKVIAVSEFLKREVLKLGISEKKVDVVYSGVPDLQQAKIEGFHLEGKIITFVGGLVRQKGVDLLIMAYKDVKHRFPDSSLVIVGDGKERKVLERLSDRLGLGVHFLGYRQDLKSILEKSVVFVLPSREEGFGLALLEAMAAGVPVITSKVGGVGEIVEDGYNGIMVEKGNTKELAGKIIRVLEDDRLRDKLIKNGRETLKRFSWERMANEVDSIYKELKGREPA